MSDWTWLAAQIRVWDRQRMEQEGISLGDGGKGRASLIKGCGDGDGGGDGEDDGDGGADGGGDGEGDGEGDGDDDRGGGDGGGRG
jgi:hypothetical protein